jgi:hypothetical protein
MPTRTLTPAARLSIASVFALLLTAASATVTLADSTTGSDITQTAAPPPTSSYSTGAGLLTPTLWPPEIPPGGETPLPSPAQFPTVTDPFGGFGTPAPPQPAAPSPTPETSIPTTVPPSTPSPSTISNTTPLPTGAAPVEDDNTVVLENADNAEQVKEDQWIATGNVKVRYRKYAVTSDRLDLDLDAGTARFSGNIVMTSPEGDRIDGGPTGWLRLNLNNHTYTVANSRTSIAPSRLGLGFIEPLIVYNGEVTVQPGFIDARGVDVTTCDYTKPHYHFLARDMYIVPGKRLVAKYVALYRRNWRVFALPYLVVPLNQRASTLNPQFGETPDEGYYAKFAIGYLLSTDLPGILHIDLMQRKGVGLGFDQYYGNPLNPKSPSGEITGYELPDKSLGRNTLTAGITNHEQLGDIVASFTGQMEQDSYTLGDLNSRALTSQMSLARNVGNLDSTFSMGLSNSDYGTGSSQTLTSSFNQAYRPTSNEELQTQLNYSQFTSSYSGAPSTETGQLNTSVEYDEQDRLFAWKFLANKYTLVSSSSQFAGSILGGLEKLPEFDADTDPTHDPFLKRLLPKPAHLSFSYGNYNEPSSRTKTDRLNFGLDTGSNTLKLDSWQAIDLSGSVLQRFYGDDAAEYVLSDHDAYRLRIGRRSTASLRYDYLRAYGYSPFQFDVQGNTNIMSGNLAYQETKTFQLNLATGYDISAARQSSLFGPPQPWQSASFQTLFTPSHSFGWRQSSTYDLNHGQFVDLTDNFEVMGRGQLVYNLGARYAPQQHRMADTTGSVDLPFWRDQREDAGWRAQAIGGYNGYTDSWDYKGLAITRSWHDWEMSLIYQDNPIGFETGQTWTINVRLKAFPAYEPFATGNFGQSLDTGLGSVY